MTDYLPVTLSSSLDRQRYSREFKRQIVEESMATGISIAALAYTHGINANLLHKWRWCYRNGELGTASLSLSTAQRHVRLSSTQQSKPNPSSQAKSLANSTGHIELLAKETRVLIHGTTDRQTLRNVIDALRTLLAYQRIHKSGLPQASPICVAALMVLLPLCSPNWKRILSAVMSSSSAAVRATALRYCGGVRGEGFANDASVIRANAQRQHAVSGDEVIDWVEEKYDIKPKQLVGDTNYGTAPMLDWMVNSKGIETHVPVWDKSERNVGALLRNDFQWDEAANEYHCPKGYALRSN